MEHARCSGLQARRKKGGRGSSTWYLHGNLQKSGGYGPASLLLECSLVPSSISKMLFWRIWRIKAAAQLTTRSGFRSGPLLDVIGIRQLLFSSYLRARDKMLLRSILCGGVWNGFLVGKSKEEDVPCRFCESTDQDGHLSLDCQFSFGSG